MPEMDCDTYVVANVEHVVKGGSADAKQLPVAANLMSLSIGTYGVGIASIPQELI